MKSKFILTAEDFLSAVVDTRYDLCVVGINADNADKVAERLRDLYGKTFDLSGGEVFVEGNNSLFKDRYSDGDLLHVMERLTAEDGCPWDKAQTHSSIRINAVEEAYELSETIDNADIDNMIEEIGDLLLQAVFHMNIAERSEEFSRTDVIHSLVHKLVSRHTHIFGDKKADNPDEALKAWEDAKAVEKNTNTLQQQLLRVPQSFPSLLRTQKVLKKLIKDGLVNNAPPASVQDLIITVCGCIKSGLDAEVDISRALNSVIDGYASGKIKNITDIKKD